MAILPIIKYIPSGGLAPIYPSTITSITNIQKNTLYNGLKTADLTLEVSSQGKNIRIKTAANITTTPPSLSGTDLRIA